MDLNGDGKLDLLSGSYSRQDPDMAGLLQVLWGQKDGSFQAAEVLNGSDGAPLIIPASKEQVTDKICTRPFAVDLDGDGKLDLVVGNFTGTFAFFRGEGGGKFAPKPTWIEGPRVDCHGDPFVVDWDGDGLLDIVSGSAQGGVFWFKNTGSKTQPKFGEKQTIVPAPGHQAQGVVLGDGHVQKPGSDTRVWVADVNGDGKPDLLVGDMWSLAYPAAGLAEATVRKELAAWTEKEQKVYAMPQNDQAAQQKFSEAYEELTKAREKFIRDERTGFVWVYYGK